MRLRVGDDETVANIFSRAYSETHSIADAFWVTSAVIGRRATHDVGAIGLNRLIAQVAAVHGLKPKSLLGNSRRKEVCAARYEVWWRARQHTPPVSYPALAAAFDRDHSTVFHGVEVFEAMLAKSAELRARMVWDRAA